jgi:hypothetical protein
VRDIDVRQPREDDVLGSTFALAGIATAFEGTVIWRLQVGAETIDSGSIQAGSMGVMTDFAKMIKLDVGTRPRPAVLEVFGDNPGLPEHGPSPGTSLNSIPVILVPGARGFVECEVKAGDTLSEIALESPFGRSSVEAIMVANAELIKDPDHIEIGWRLRVPVL